MNWTEFVQPYLPDGNYTLVPPEGPHHPEIVLVGEAPGADEVNNRVRGMLKPRPFVGWAGKELDKMLAEAGINRMACLILNTCMERPPGNKFQSYFYQTLQKPRRRVPTQKLLQWWKCLEACLIEAKPNVVVAFGNEPLLALTGLGGITKRRGSIYKTKHGFKVIPVVHPAAVLRNWRMRTIAVHDLIRVKEESYTSEVTPDGLTLITDPSY
jgi:uracil-DNA glycosylase family 4